MFFQRRLPIWLFFVPQEGTSQAKPEPCLVVRCRRCDDADHMGGTCQGFWRAKAQHEQRRLLVELERAHGPESEEVQNARAAAQREAKAYLARAEREAALLQQSKQQRRRQAEANRLETARRKVEKRAEKDAKAAAAVAAAAVAARAAAATLGAESTGVPS